jgi:hypothetical protein
MPNYLLLRSNRQTGPHSLEALIALGMKPYDLVWVEGKSAGWRYPFEIKELQPYAPPAVEQPFDRFYKKQEPQTHPALELMAAEHKSYLPTQTMVAEAPVSTPTPPAHPKKNYVAISMPLQAAATNHKANATEETTTPRSNSFASTTSIHPTPSNFTDKLVVNEETPPLEEKYSMPLSEIKKMYVANLSQKKKNKTLSIPSHLKLVAGVAAVFTGIIVIGVLISHFNKKPNSIQAMPMVATPSYQTNLPDNSEIKNTDENTAIHSIPPVQTIPSNNKTNNTIATPNAVVQKNIAAAPAGFKTIKTNKTTINTAPVLAETASSNKDKEQALPASESHDVKEEVSVEIEKKADNANRNNNVNYNSLEADKQFAKKRMKKLVIARNTDYKVGLLGGIKDFSIAVANHSAFKIDLVIVAVDYIKANGELVKTEQLYFKNIPAETDLTLAAPNSNKGVKIDYRIVLISSKELDYNYATVN